MDSSRKQVRISVNMADVGSARLPFIIDSIRQKAEHLFNQDSIDYAAGLQTLSPDSANAAADSSKRKALIFNLRAPASLF